MDAGKSHIAVCICTYKRQDLLETLLHRLEKQVTDDIFEYSIVIVDNDRNESAKTVVDSIREHSKPDIRYYTEPEQNIAMARNKAVENAGGDFIAFIDDDEIPTDRWLLTLYATCEKWNADGVLGPVYPRFAMDPPEWVIKGRFFERPSHETGTVLKWQNTRTGNVLIRKKVFDDKRNRFDRKFLTGEDRDFFRRMIGEGHVFFWCNEAPVYENIPPLRWQKSFMLKRALFRGKIALNYPGSGVTDLLKSILAVVLYTAFLPASILLGQHVFMKYMVKNCDHLGKILAYCGIDVVRQKYVTE
jgi:glycosyltransferase involved in cell wall biosynthesis